MKPEAHPKSRSNWVVYLILVIVGIGLGIGGFLLAFVLGTPLLTEGKASESWPSTTGVVIESKLSSRRVTGSGKNAGSHTKYFPVVKYTYEFNGTAFTGDRIRIGGQEGDEAEMRSILDQYPVDSEVTVFYSPEAPEQSVLRTGTSGGTYIALISGITMLVIGALMLLFVIVRVVPHK